MPSWIAGASVQLDPRIRKEGGEKGGWRIELRAEIASASEVGMISPGPQQRRSTVVVETGVDGIVSVRVVECSEEETGASPVAARPAILSESEYNLLEALDIGIDRPLTTTPFLTLYRRRERQPVLQPWSHLMNILDDSYHGVSERLLGQVDRWAFNTFALDVSSGGRSMPLLLVHLFHEYGFLGSFKLDVVRVWHCFNLIAAGYHSNNPYHNSVHAADVTQAMHCFLLESKIREHMTPVEAMAALIAAVTHDLDHPGVNQPFLIATSNHLAALYKNFSVLENHHWRSAISCLRQSGIFDHLDSSVWDEMEYHIRSLILATDITRQQEFLSRFKRYMENNALDMADKEYRHFILQIALKCADLGNPCRPWDISHRWSLQVCKEFYRQDFFKFVVSPLFEIWDQFLGTELSRELLNNLRLNHVQWEKKVAIEAIAASSFETDLNAPLASEEEEGDLEFEDEEETLPPLLTRGRGGAAAYSWMEESLGSSAWGRRHSMPLSLPKLPSRTVIRRRRQSLPLSSLALPPQPDQTSEVPAGPRSPRVSAEDLQPTTSLLSLSSTAEGAPVTSLLQRSSRESERRLVHQPVSYPPYRRTSEPFVAAASRRHFPRRSESVFAFTSTEVEPYEEVPGGEVENKRQQEDEKDFVQPTGSKGNDPCASPPSSGCSTPKSGATNVDSGPPLPPWSHRVSLSSEREAQQLEFDHPPEALWRNCARFNSRRSSAPTTLGGGERQVSFWGDQNPSRDEELSGPPPPPSSLIGALRRRSSVPTEQHLPELGNTELAKLARTAAAAFGRRPMPRTLMRRHSIAFLEPVAPSSESEDGSSTCATSTACSTRRGSCVPPRRISDSSRDEDETRDLFLPFVASTSSSGTATSPGALRRRRGSLPADVPLPLMVCAEKPPGRTGVSVDPLDPTRRRGSTGEILSCLIGPYGALHALQNLPRRGSGGGLELLSGLWRSRGAALGGGSDWSPGSSVIPPQPVSVAGRFKLQRQACSLESTGLQSTCSSAAGSVFSTTQRRGSFPLDFSLFSFSSGELFCCDDGGD
ncbi:cAMP-specific 3,5-cyclic phosphodiesterase, putative [Ixodes scapularis]|uniref:Phosphodiesterase n=1 Tax=Ixodes scapularis TaxID=6945 RepID=B7PF82_IXOSC|nr:cAMP-specific 3,5-cyclic phosphodiesterase, putative [Ixodes scapularis]|eukprot:XP_002433854.1 cAMP-specific 3,5-cyclic phosphodiesterase, putative [Ixodes scapularis]